MARLSTRLTCRHMRIATALLLGLASLVAMGDTDRPRTQVRLAEGRIEYRGVITADANAVVLGLYAAA